MNKESKLKKVGIAIAILSALSLLSYIIHITIGSFYYYTTVRDYFSANNNYTNTTQFIRGFYYSIIAQSLIRIVSILAMTVCYWLFRNRFNKISLVIPSALYLISLLFQAGVPKMIRAGSGILAQEYPFYFPFGLEAFIVRNRLNYYAGRYMFIFLFCLILISGLVIILTNKNRVTMVRTLFAFSAIIIVLLSITTFYTVPLGHPSASLVYNSRAMFLLNAGWVSQLFFFIAHLLLLSQNNEGIQNTYSKKRRDINQTGQQVKYKDTSRYCPKCGLIVRNDAIYCKRCGVKL